MALAPSVVLRLEEAEPREIDGALLTAWIVKVPDAVPVAAPTASELASTTLQLMVRLGPTPLAVSSALLLEKVTARRAS